MKLSKALTVVGSYTALSRISGYFRDTILVHFLGATGLADVLFLSTKIASLFRRLFAEGAFNASFVPLFTQKQENYGIDSAKRFSERVLFWFGAFLICVIILGELFMPEFISVIASGYKEGSDKFKWAVQIMYIIFPYVGVISLTAILGAVLNSLHKYADTAANPLIGNVTIIVLFMILKEEFETYAHAAAWCILLSCIVQFIALYIVCARNKILLIPRVFRFSKSVRTFFVRVLPGIVGTGIVQINLLISIIFGSYLPDGGISYLQVSERVNQFPLSIISAFIGSVLLPVLTKNIQANQLEKAIDVQRKAMHVSLLFSIPIFAFVWYYGEILLSVLFLHGKFKLEDVYQSTPTLIAFVVGLPAYIILKIFSSTFFAQKDTMRPTIVGFLSLVINAVLCLAVVDDMFFAQQKHVGIAAALAISGWFNALVLGVLAYRRGIFRLEFRTISYVLRVIIATVCVTIPIHFTHDFVHQYIATTDMIVKITLLSSIIAGPTVLFIAIRKLLKI